MHARRENSTVLGSARSRGYPALGYSAINSTVSQLKHLTKLENSAAFCRPSPHRRKQRSAKLALNHLEEVFEKLSKGKSFFGEDRISYLDIALGCYVGRLRVLETMNGLKLLDEEKTPLLARWAASFSEHKIVKVLTPETDKLAEFAKMLGEYLRIKDK